MEQPEINSIEGWYISAFWDLTSERDFGEIIGDIPWSKAMLYAREHGIEEDYLDAFWLIIRMLDAGYREHLRKEFERESRYAKQRRSGQAVKQKSRGR